MKRRLRNPLTVLSLLLCVAVVALWVRSYRTFDGIGYSTGRNYYGVDTFPGGLSLWRTYHPEVHPSMRDGWSRSSHAYGPGHLAGSKVTWVAAKHDWSRLGFTAAHTEYSKDPTTPGAIVPRAPGRPLDFASWSLCLPAWFLALSMTLLPTMRAVRFLRSRRRRTRHECPACGYDLRATPGRCPECGTEANESRSAAQIDQCPASFRPADQ